MFKVSGSDGLVYGLVDTLTEAKAILDMKKMGRDGKPNGGNTKVSTMTFDVSECPDSAHPGFVKR